MGALRILCRPDWRDVARQLPPDVLAASSVQDGPTVRPTASMECPIRYREHGPSQRCGRPPGRTLDFRSRQNERNVEAASSSHTLSWN